MEGKNIKRGKKARASGTRFERKVRENLEKEGWIVSKWMNNVGMWDKKGNQVIKKNETYLIQKTKKEIKFKEIIFDKCVQAKHKFRGFGIPMAIGTGFPDFLSMRRKENLYEVIGVESKSGKYLDKTEKEKCDWLLKNKIFSKILVAYKNKKKRGEILYKEYENNKTN